MAALQLIGFMGCGKSTYGALLAISRNLPFLDLDKVIEQAAGQDLTSLFDKRGEAAFRDLERQIYLEQAAGFSGVLATGGGLALQEGMDVLMPEVGPVLHLDPPLDWLLEYLRRDKSRPLLAGLDEMQRERRIRELYARRDSRYRKIAKRSVQLPDPQNVPDCLDRLLAAWELMEQKRD